MFNLREKIEEMTLKRDFNKFNRKAESLQRKIEVAEQRKKYYEIRADEVIKSTNRLRHASEESSNFGFAGNP